MDRKEIGTQGLPSLRKSGVGGRPSRGGTSKATGLVRRTQERLAGACGEGQVRRTATSLGGAVRVDTRGQWRPSQEGLSGWAAVREVQHFCTKDALVPRGEGKGMLRTSEFCDELDFRGPD